MSPETRQHHRREDDFYEFFDRVYNIALNNKAGQIGLSNKDFMAHTMLENRCQKIKTTYSKRDPQVGPKNKGIPGLVPHGALLVAQTVLGPQRSRSASNDQKINQQRHQRAPHCET